MSETNGLTNGVHKYYALEVAQQAPLTPVACAAFASPVEAGKRRNFDCRFYETCLDVAIKNKWDSFTCKACKAYDPYSRLEMIKKSRGLLAIFDPDVE